MADDDLNSRVKCISHWYGNSNLTPPITTVKAGQYLIFGGVVALAIFQNFGIFGSGNFSNSTAGETQITTLYKSDSNLDLKLHVICKGTTTDIYTERMYVELIIFVL